MVGAAVGWLSSRISGMDEKACTFAGIVIGGVYDFLIYKIKTWIKARLKAGRRRKE